jgi:hypothetical protein
VIHDGKLPSVHCAKLRGVESIATAPILCLPSILRRHRQSGGWQVTAQNEYCNEPIKHAENARSHTQALLLKFNNGWTISRSAERIEIDMDLGLDDSDAAELRDALRVDAAPALPQHHTFKTSLVHAMLTQHWDKDKQPDGKTTKVNPDALKLAAEYLRLFVIGKCSSRSSA